MDHKDGRRVHIKDSSLGILKLECPDIPQHTNNGTVESVEYTRREVMPGSVYQQHVEG